MYQGRPLGRLAHAGPCAKRRLGREDDFIDTAPEPILAALLGSGGVLHGSAWYGALLDLLAVLRISGVSDQTPSPLPRLPVDHRT